MTKDGSEKRIKKYFKLGGFPFALVVGILLLVGFGFMKEGISQQLFEYHFIDCQKKVTDFFNPVIGKLDLMKSWGEAGLISFKDKEKLDKAMIPLFKTPEFNIFSISLADSAGYEYIITSDGKEFESEMSKVKYEGNDLKNAPAPSWFANMAENQEGEIFWTLNDDLFGEGVSGSIAALYYTVDGQSSRTQVAGVGFTLSEFDKFIHDLELSDKSRLLLYEDGNVLELHRSFVSSIRDELQIKSEQEELKSDPIVDLAIKKWLDSKETEAVAFNHKGDRWWFSVVPFERDKNDTMIALVMPESDLLSEVKTIKFYGFGFGIVLLIGLSFASFLTIRKYKGQLEHVNRKRMHTDDSDQQLLELIASGESHDLEFKSTLRWNLKSDRAGKEIEMSVLKTIVAYLNSDGGTLLVGVQDDGEILGIEADKFANDDKAMLHLNNLIKQHIGLEFASYINYRIRNINGRSFIVIDTLPSTKPAYLKNNNEEDFYIRVGPGSRKLPMSKAFEYINRSRTKKKTKK